MSALKQQAAFLHQSLICYIESLLTVLHLIHEWIVLVSLSTLSLFVTWERKINTLCTQKCVGQQRTDYINKMEKSVKTSMASFASRTTALKLPSAYWLYILSQKWKWICAEYKNYISVQEHCWCKHCNGWWPLQKVLVKQLLTNLLSASVVKADHVPQWKDAYKILDTRRCKSSLLHIISLSKETVKKEAKDLANSVQWKYDTCKINEIATEWEHMFLQLPPYHCEWTLNRSCVAWVKYCTIINNAPVRTPKMKH